jgi:outer membrane protein OmpA-like peptidoglycan-associated protein
MKKIALLVLLCVSYLVPSMMSAQEVTYVEDPSQGYLFNRMRDNWFIQADGGVGMIMSSYDKHLSFGKRLGAKADLFIGKWFSPLLGLRGGVDFEQLKGATWVGNYAALGYRGDIQGKDPGFVFQHFNDIGLVGDVLFNVSNWLCGYKPYRFYNCIFYVGMTVNWVYARDGARPISDGPWKYGANDDPDHSRNYSMQAGLLNSFAITKRFDLNIDLRFDLMQEHIDGAGMGYRTWNEYPGILVGLTYKLGKTEWNAPVTAVCPEWKYTDAEGDALVANLNDANRKIADLEDQLRKCLEKKPAEITENGIPAAEAPLATIYFPINRTDVLGVQRNVLEAVSEVMKNENRNYLLTGWADNYTGNDQINVRLRKGRVATVKKELVNKGVADSRLETEINNGELTNYGPKAASLDRAVTIHRK